jgi:hypothetical protein
VHPLSLLPSHRLRSVADNCLTLSSLHQPYSFARSARHYIAPRWRRRHLLPSLTFFSRLPHRSALAANGLVAALSRASRKILPPAARGLTGREIAGQLGRARAPRRCTAAVMHKTGAHNVADLVPLVMRSQGT